MTRGNQRDLAREKKLKKDQDRSKGHREDGLSHAARKEADAERMRQKQIAAENRKACGGS
ncbi:hypothetical protein JKF63_07809 [Porcisia hertigi]|uniref:Small EDRK-rich factor-like N-terminal domain-containing protein n=1 Tax=Porcisia hertigi TaxID=2761500 RepID=A0A836LMH2_9TRYP|nr:hypothetical protein JKF63_07809 [Porcisia hertigi]